MYGPMRFQNRVFTRPRPTAVACYTKLIAPQWIAAIIGIGLPQRTERRLLLLCYHS
jgi:hypothetical protein